MSTDFKFKLNKDKNVKLNIEHFNLNKLKLKVRGISKQNKKFSAYITIKFNDVSNKIVVEKINISHLEIENSSEENSYLQYRSIYKPFHLPSSSCSSSSSSSSSSCENEELYRQLKTFTKNIKLLTKNNKVDYILFSLHDTNIKKMKLRGKLY
jgi:hypothetical protein